MFVSDLVKVIREVAHEVKAGHCSRSEVPLMT